MLLPDTTGPHMKRLPRCVTLLLCCIGLSACQHGALPAETTDNTSSSETVVQERAFNSESLHTLLIGEMALHRRQYPLALKAYTEEAQASRDLGVTARASEIAAALNHPAATLQSARLWSELEPDNPRPHALAGHVLLQQQRLPEALEYLLTSYRLGGESRLAAVAAQANPAIRARLRAQLDEALPRDADNPDLLLADALLRSQDKQYPAALRSVRAALIHIPNDLRAINLEARILLALQQPEEALQRLQQLARQHPDDLRLQTEYARTLARVHPEQGQQAFQQLAERYPQHPELLMAQALLAQDNGDTEIAGSLFEQLLAQGHYRDEARFHLGNLATDQHHTDTAIAHWQAVEPGPLFLDARRRLIGLLLEQHELDKALQRLQQDRDRLDHDQPAQAALQQELWLMEAEALLQMHQADASLAVLDRLIAAYGPIDRLLYTRSLAYEKLGNLAGLEQDLRQLLERDPDNATVLNALGYSLSNLSQRHDEARQLIERAHALQPNDAAITDSLGWVHYRLGNLRRATRYLREAYAAYPDAEIGAHLGEVLWVQNQRDEALNLWRSLAERDARHPVLRETVQRLTGRTLEELPHAAP